MSRWFRFYDDAINDPKLLKLSDAQFRFWIGVLCIASKTDGMLPSNEDIAIHLRMKLEKTTAAFQGLINAGLIDVDETGNHPHNWSGRQFKSDSSNERVKRYRKQKCNVTSTVTVTPPETEQITEQKEDAALRPPISDQETELFRRGKDILGENAGGIIAKLKRHTGSIPKTRAILETASTKQNAREYVMRILNGQTHEGFSPSVGAIV